VVLELASERLYLLPQILTLDGRLSSHPLDARGFAPLNCFLVREPGHALLIDTGFSAYEDVLLRQLGSLIEPTERLSVWALRLGEYASISNVRPVVEHFAVDVLYGSQGVPPEWVDFRPEHVPYGSPVAAGALGQIDHRLARQGDAIGVGSGGRLLHTLVAPLRLLPTNWVYDEATRTLFTADAFAYVWQPTAHGPWTVSDDDDPTTLDGALECMLGSRFWWLAGARTEPLRRGIDEIFETYPIETIAPSFGCVLAGRRTVERHHRLLDEILAQAASMPSIGQDIAGWRTGVAA
jgi:flavorubredoxin